MTGLDHQKNIAHSRLHGACVVESRPGFKVLRGLCPGQFFAKSPKVGLAASDTYADDTGELTMAANPALLRNMLRTYGKQITTSRRLARYRRTLRAAGADDQVNISREARRRELVHKVAAEIVESLIVTGSENPVVTEIKKELEAAFRTKFSFVYPPEDQDLQIFKILGHNEAEEITGPERVRVLESLWNIALEKVDETML